MNVIGALRLRRPGTRRLSVFSLGLVFLVATAVVLLILINKARLETIFRPGDTITAEFSEDYGLEENKTEVKVAGIQVGVVTDVEEADDGNVLVSMKVDDSAQETLGSEPSARIAPNTVLGGTYSLELARGGATGPFEGATIPVERTSVPVELDRILESLPGRTRKSVQDVVGNFEGSLANGGREALREMVNKAPDTLEPAGKVLEAARGTRPGTDLPQLVTNLNSTADALNGQGAKLGKIVDSLSRTTQVLAAESEPLAETISGLPETFQHTRTGLIDLRGTVNRLERTAQSARPIVRELDPLLQELNPVLAETRPLLHELNPLLKDLRPAVDDLVPTAKTGTKILEDVRGPVLNRVQGPILDTVMNTWRGEGPYKNSGGGIQADHKFYEELGYLVANLDRASMTQDAQGSLLGFQVGAGTQSLAGTPLTLPNLLEHIEDATGGAP